MKEKKKDQLTYIPKAEILPAIDCPQDLKGLSPAELKQLANEIRAYILAVVSQNGGHLAPNLGVVELTLALHSVLDLPQDKIVWDVGHQSYTHKILTGRREEFRTLRTYGGLSGFPKAEESVYDSFDTGHSSTSISVALGLAKARDLKHDNHHVVAVIGDGALTGGMAYEALNNGGVMRTPLIVILNDNEMSITNNVGAISDYLTRMRTDPRYGKTKLEIETLLKSIPRVGPQVVKVVDRLKDSLKYFLVPGMLFEDLGFVYLGPVDGHDIEEMQKTIVRAKNMKCPVLIHVLTQKGKGYRFAEENPDKFHGIGPFNLEDGSPLTNGNSKSYTDIFSDALLKLAAKDEKIISVIAAMCQGTGTEGFFQRFPERSFDVGIAEGHAVTFAAAMAKEGYRPVVSIYSTFLQRAYDQLLHDVCLTGLPVTIAIDRAGLVGEDGPTHQGVFDISFLRTMPNMVLMAPKDENELQRMLATALSYPGPAAIRYPKGKGPGSELDCEILPLPIGRAEVLRQGVDVAIFALGSMVYPSLKAADILAERGVSAGVINARFVSPLDGQTLLEVAKKTGRVLTVEENIQSGGFGSACAELLANEEAELLIAALPQEFIPQGTPDGLLDKYGLTAQKLAEKIMNAWFKDK